MCYLGDLSTSVHAPLDIWTWRNCKDLAIIIRAWLCKDPKVPFFTSKHQVSPERIVLNFESLEAQVLSPLGVRFYYWIFCFHAVKTKVPILAFSYSLWKTRVMVLIITGFQKYIVTVGDPYLMLKCSNWWYYKLIFCNIISDTQLLISLIYFNFLKKILLTSIIRTKSEFFDNVAFDRILWCSCRVGERMRTSTTWLCHWDISESARPSTEKNLNLPMIIRITIES